MIRSRSSERGVIHIPAGTPVADRAFLDEYDSGDAFAAAMSKLAPWPRHRLGGHATPVQRPVELDAAQAHLDLSAPYDNDRTLQAVHDEAQRWTLLAQIDSDDDAGMQWGDVGTLYWLIRPEDLACWEPSTIYAPSPQLPYRQGEPRTLIPHAAVTERRNWTASRMRAAGACARNIRASASEGRPPGIPPGAYPQLHSGRLRIAVRWLVPKT